MKFFHQFFTFAASVALLLCATSSRLRAAEETTTYRVVGLFEPSRTDDLRQLIATAAPELQIGNIDFDKAEVTLRFELANLFPDGKVPKGFTSDKVMQKIDSVISGKSKGTFHVTTPSALPPEKQTRVDIKVGLLDCKGCRYGAYQMLSKIDGVERATVGIDTHVLTVWIDPAKTNREALEAVLKKAQVSIFPL